VWALGALGAIALFYLWPVLLGGRQLLPNSVLFNLAPWASKAPAGFRHGLDPLLTDIPSELYPWNVFARQLIHSGQFPAWNPYEYSGTPFFANAQTAVLSPFSVPLWVLSLKFGLGVAAWLKLWVGGCGAYLLARRLRLGFWPGLLAGIGYMLCAFNVLWLEWEVHTAVAAMLPWALLFCEQIATRRRFADVAGLAVATLIAILAGMTEIAVLVMFSAGIYLVVRIAALEGLAGGERARRFGWGVGGLVLGALMSAVVLLPVLEAGLGTPGAKALTDGGFLLPWSAARTALFPGWWNPFVVGQGPVDYVERTFYVGVATVLLGFVGVLSRGHWREKLPLATLAVLGVAIAFRFPGVFWLAVHLPGLNETQVARLLLWPELAVPVLAAFGLQRLIEAPTRQRGAWPVVGVAVAVAVVAVISVHPSLHELRTGLNHFRTGRDYTEAKIISLISVGWWVLFVILFGVVLALMRHYRRPRLAAAVLVLLVLIDLLHFSSGFNPMLPASIANPPSTPAVEWLQAHAGDQRVVGDGYTLVNDYESIYGLRDIRGYDPPQPESRYLNLWLTVKPFPNPPLSLVLPGPGRATVRLMNVLATRYLITSPGAPAAAYAPLKLVYSGSDATVFADPGAAPLALIAKRVIVTSGEAQTLATVTKGPFDPRSEAVVEHGQPGIAALPASANGGSVTITSRRNSLVTLKAQSPHPALVVLNDAVAPGWNVTVDGQSHPAIRVNDVMRGVVIPAGTHRVTWNYEVPGLRLGLLITIVSMLSLIASAIPVRRRAKKRQGRTQPAS
jgi:hypothetical protein